MNNNTLPSVNCPNCGAFSSSYDNCEFCGSSLASVVSKELLAADKARKRQLAEEIERQQKAKAEQQRKAAEAEQARQQAEADKQKREESRRKLKKALPFIVLAVVLAVGGGILYNNMVRLPNIERAAWEFAVQRNTVESFEAFIREHPNSEHIDTAETQLQLLFAELRRQQAEEEERRRAQAEQVAQDRAREAEERRRAEEEMQRGVMINGVRWATRNVDAPGTFAARPESTGMFFQWNRRRGWTATGNVTGWDSSTPTGTSWERANDPCPQGWRVPTRAEQTSLYNSRNTWVSNWNNTGVAGRTFGTIPNQIFLPAVGCLLSSSGLQNDSGLVSGLYWNSQNEIGEDNWRLANSLFFHSSGAVMISGQTSRGFSIRCVAIN